MPELSKAVMFYASDHAHRRSVDALLNVNDAPDDLTLAELEDFEAAQLAAQKVRFDLWLLLRSVWRQTWGASVVARWPRISPLNVGQHASVMTHIPSHVPDVKAFWERKETYGAYILPSKQFLLTGVRLIDAKELAVFCWIVKSDGYDLDETLDLGPNWYVDDDDWSVARSPVAEFDLQTSAVSVESLRQTTDAATNSIAEAIHS